MIDQVLDYINRQTAEIRTRIGRIQHKLTKEKHHFQKKLYELELQELVKRLATIEDIRLYTVKLIDDEM